MTQDASPNIKRVIDEELLELAKLVKTKNSVDREISKIVGRPALIGHVGEFIASKVFGITLHKSASTKGSDGVFKVGPYAGKTVNIKWYTTGDNSLDLDSSAGAEYYLVLSGSKATSWNDRLWTIDSVYLFASSDLINSLRRRRVKIGIATSVRNEDWVAAEIYPLANDMLRLTEEQKKLLELFQHDRRSRPNTE